MPAKLTEEHYTKRRQAISEMLKEARTEYSNSALEAATKPNADTERLQRGCRERIQDLEEQIKALDAAWSVQCERDVTDKQAAELDAYRADDAKIAEMADRAAAMGKEAGEHLNAFLAAWKSICELEDDMRKVMMPWSRKSGQTGAMFPLTQVRRDITLPLSATLTNAGLPVEALNSSAQHHHRGTNLAALLGEEGMLHRSIMQNLEPKPEQRKAA